MAEQKDWLSRSGSFEFGILVIGAYLEFGAWNLGFSQFVTLTFNLPISRQRL
jgi:hypothetical protein